MHRALHTIINSWNFILMLIRKLYYYLLLTYSKLVPRGWACHPPIAGHMVLPLQNYQYACDREQRFSDRLRIMRISLFERRQQQNNCTAERTHYPYTHIYYNNILSSIYDPPFPPQKIYRWSGVTRSLS